MRAFMPPMWCGVVFFFIFASEMLLLSQISVTMLEYKGFTRKCAKYGVCVFGAVALALGGCVASISSVYAQKVDKQIVCHIKGTVVDNPECRYLLLLPSGADSRITKCDTIPVGGDGRFSYTLRRRCNEPYELIAGNELSQHYVAVFIAENGTVNVTLYPFRSDRRPMITSQAPVNKEMLRVHDDYRSRFFEKLERERETLESTGKDYTPEMQELKEKWIKAADDKEREALWPLVDSLVQAGKEYTAEYLEVNRKYEEAMRMSAEYLLDYAAENRTLVGLYYLFNCAQSAKRHGDGYVQRVADVYNAHYAGLFVDNAMSGRMRNWIASLQIRVGGKFIDFTAPDVDGKEHRLSDEIKGKVALIDLWASWCGPCRRKSKSMIPLYETYKDKGFTVVGVARERDSDAAMRKAVQQDAYPWLNMLEIDDRIRLWERYGVGQSGGRTVLVDATGTILALDPTAEEVEAILQRSLVR